MATSIFKEYFKGYEILGELGRGNARVLKARSLHTGALVAIKHFAFNTDTDTLRRFQRESEIMKSIAHRYIVKIIDVHLDAELPYIVMQLIEGGDLRSLLKTYGSLDIDTLITLARHMVEALGTIHAQRIVHRDIKPENIMYRRLASGALEFLLTDFGIARLREQADSITVTGASMLTYDYASPEQFSQSKMVDAATDYYSLGIVLYECLTGSVPFEFEQDDLLMHINRVISAPLPVPVMRGGHRPPAGILLLLEALLRKQAPYRLCDPVTIDSFLQMAEKDDSAGEVLVRSHTPLQTLPYTPQQLPLPRRKKWRPVSFSIVFFLLTSILLFSWANFETYKSKMLPSLTRISPPAAITAKQVSKVTHRRQPRPVTNEHSSTLLYDAGVPLVNGIYYNDFDQQDSVWNTGSDDNSEYILLDGKYMMKGFNDSLSYSSFVKLDMDAEKDFTVAATAAHQGTGTGDPYGIIFCGDDSRDAFFVFYLTSNGYYSIGTSVKDKWNVLTDWTASSNIRQDGEMNVFSIERREGKLRFLVNGQVERVLNYDGGFGNYFGLRADGAQTIAFDNFVVKGTSPANKYSQVYDEDK